jgi:hypothetical protein
MQGCTEFAVKLGNEAPLLLRFYKYTITALVMPMQLQVQSLGLAFTLRLEYSLSCSSKVFHVDPHSALSQCHQPSLGADGLDIRTGQIILLVDELVKVNVFI